MDSWNGRSVIPDREWTSDAELEFFTDASTRGYGGFYAGEWIAGYFNDWLFKRSIPFKELFALVAAVATWGHRWRGKKIRVHCDSETVVNVLNRKRAKTPAMAALLRILYLLCAQHDCWIGAVHIAGVKNEVADALSRGWIQKFFQLCPGASQNPSPIPPELFTCFSQLDICPTGEDCGEIERRILATIDSAQAPNGAEAPQPPSLPPGPEEDINYQDARTESLGGDNKSPPVVFTDGGNDTDSGPLDIHFGWEPPPEIMEEDTTVTQANRTRSKGTTFYPSWRRPNRFRARSRGFRTEKELERDFGLPLPQFPSSLGSGRPDGCHSNSFPPWSAQRGKNRS